MPMLITGATGFVGRRLVERVQRPVVLSRNAARAQEVLGDVTAYEWSPQREPPPAAALESVDAIVHLAGESIAAGRWTAERKRRIRESRVVGTEQLVAGLASLARRPAVLVSASAVGYYGSRGDEWLDETSSPGDDFLAHVCRDWEQAALAANELGMRVVLLRLGVVLGPRGGALEKMLPIFRLGLGGRLGSGRQWMPWVHLDDVVGLALRATQDSSLAGPVNVVGPTPVTNREFTQALAAVLHRPAWFPAPAFALKLAVGEFSETLLGSQRVMPRVAQQAGYAFQHADVKSALTASVG